MKTYFFSNFLSILTIVFFCLTPLIGHSESTSVEKLTIEDFKKIINKKTLKEKEISELIILNINSFSSNELSKLEQLLLKSYNLDTATIGLKFIDSGNKELFSLGIELISDLCVTRPEYFQPNTFFDAFMKLGPLSEPYIVNIIRNTQNDFCREWACELYVRMFSKLYADDEDRKKLLIIYKKEQKIYKNLKNFFNDPSKVKKLFETQQSLGNVIRKEWDDNNRYPLRLLAVISLLDNLDESNYTSIVKKIFKIIDSRRFDYNILYSMYLPERNSPSIPDELRLRYLAKAVFINGSEDTYRWLSRERGGFSKEDLKLAIKKNDKKRIDEMERILHQFICALLMKELIYGDGNREINLLREFHFATWENSLDWNDHLLTIHNRSNHGVPLILKKKSDIKKMLTGRGVTSTAAEERKEEFYIPANFKFVWFVPTGDYLIKVNLKNIEVKNGYIFKFKTKNFSIIQSNLTLNIY